MTPPRKRRMPERVDGPYIVSPRPRRVDDEARFNADVLRMLKEESGQRAFLMLVGAA